MKQIKECIFVFLLKEKPDLSIFEEVPVCNPAEETLRCCSSNYSCRWYFGAAKVMAEPTGTVENSSVLIINHPPSSVMRDRSFYTHRTTQCHSKYGWKITPNSLPSKMDSEQRDRRGLEFFKGA